MINTNVFSDKVQPIIGIPYQDHIHLRLLPFSSTITFLRDLPKKASGKIDRAKCLTLLKWRFHLLSGRKIGDRPRFFSGNFQDVTD